MTHLTEDHLQRQVATYLRNSPKLKKVLWFHTPNEGKMSPQYGAKRKAQGVRAGVPDIMICAPRYEHVLNVGEMIVNTGLAIELKVGRNKPTEAQREAMSLLKAQGWQTHVCYTYDEAYNVVEDYFK